MLNYTVDPTFRASYHVSGFPPLVNAIAYLSDGQIKGQVSIYLKRKSSKLNPSYDSYFRHKFMKLCSSPAVVFITVIYALFTEIGSHIAAMSMIT